MHKMGVAGCRWSEGLGNYFSVHRMATIAGDGRGIDPDAPTVLTIKVLYSQPGLPIADQGKQASAQLFGTSFAQYERAFARHWATCLHLAAAIRGAMWRGSS